MTVEACAPFFEACEVREKRFLVSFTYLPAVFGFATVTAANSQKELFGRAHHNTHGPPKGNVPSDAIYDVASRLKT